MRRLLLPLLAGALLAGPDPLRAQARLDRFPAAAEPAEPEPPGPSVLSVAKWGTLAASAGFAVYGFLVNSDADDGYEEIERICADAPERCVERTPDGAYTDPELESRYQEVLRLDDRARWTLLASQIGAATSVLLFILDIRESEAPPNIPYEPQELSITPRRGGGVEVGVRLRR